MTKRILTLLVAILLIFALAGCGEKTTINENNIDNTVKHGDIYDGVYNRQGIKEVSFENGVFYQIFVYNYRDSTGNGVGDIGGIIESLDYLQDLGINGIWLTPITHGASYHKYDVVDYYNVDPEFGTMEDFKELISEAHKRDIKVVMDLVINHSSDKHPWFQAAIADPESKYRDYYQWAEEGDLRLRGSGWHKLRGTDWYYVGHFWDRMPDLNYDNPKVREEVKRIAQFWLGLGVDGFRLDAAKHLYSSASKNYEFWNEFYDHLSALKEDVYLVGEIWDRPEVVAPYFANGLKVNFNFQIGDRVVMSLNNGQDRLGVELNRIYDIYKQQNPNFIDAPFLSNHDTNRIMGRLHKDTNRMKMAASILLSLPGDPYIFAGEEIGMVSDEDHMNIREPFKWYKENGPGQTTWRKNSFNSAENWSPSVEEQKDDPNSLLNHYKEVISIRKKYSPLMYGDFELVPNDNNRVLTFARTWEDKTVIVAHNFSDAEQTVTFTTNHEISGFESLNKNVKLTEKENTITITIPPLSSIYIY